MYSSHIFIEIFQNIERAFSLLKQRFPRLDKLNQKSTDKKLLIVMACCCLHNILIRENDNINYFLSNAEKVIIFHHFHNVCNLIHFEYINMYECNLSLHY